MGMSGDQAAAGQPVSRCSSHPNARAAWRCSSCNKLLCPDCAADASQANVKLVACLHCGSIAEQLQVQRSVRGWPAMLPTFAKSVLSLQGFGQYLVIAAIMCFGMAIALFPFFGSIMAMVVIYGAWGGYLFSVLRAASGGEHDLPSLRDIGSSAGELIATTFRLALATAIVWVPLLVIFYNQTASGAYQIGLVGMSNWSNPVVLLVQLFAVVYIPAAFVLAAMADSALDVINPLSVLAVIARVPGRYFSMALFCAVLYALNKLLEFGLWMVFLRFLMSGRVGFLGGLMLVFIILALLMALPTLIALVLGRFMYQNAETFGLAAASTVSQAAMPGAFPRGSLPEPDQATQAPVAAAPVALELESTPSEVLLGALKSGHDGMALDAYRRLVAGGQSPQLHPEQELLLSQILDNGGDTMGAVHALRRAAQTDLRGPMASRALYLAASLLIDKAGAAAEGQTLLRYLVDNYPGDPWAERASRLLSS